MKTYLSGSENTKSDFFISYTPTPSDELQINIISKTKILHENALKNVVHSTLNDLKINSGKLTVKDNGGQYFVLKARIEATIKSCSR